MNENEDSFIEKDTAAPGALRSIVSDDGVQRAAAGVVVALVVSVARHLLFGGSK